MIQKQKSAEELKEAFINQDILITQIMYLTGMLEYIRSGGKSRGSYIVQTNELNFSECKSNGFKVQLDNGAKKDSIQQIWLDDGKVVCKEVKRRAIPNKSTWFELVYNKYLSNEIIGQEGETTE
jgi:hypothetical protein